MKAMKEKVHYIRVSTLEQNTDRQKDIIFGALVLEDKESGTIEFKNVPMVQEFGRWHPISNLMSFMSTPLID